MGFDINVLAVPHPRAGSVRIICRVPEMSERHDFFLLVFIYTYVYLAAHARRHLAAR